MVEHRKVLLLGGGGHCKSVLDSLISSGKYSEIGIIDDNKSGVIWGVRIMGTDADLPWLIKNGWTDAFITVGSVGSTVVRHKLYQMIKDIGFYIPTIIDSSAIVSEKTELGKGIFVGKRAVVNAGSKIGNCSIINTGSIIEHDCVIGDFSHVSPGTTLCGQVSIGSNTHIGAGTVVRQGIAIGRDSLIGAGSVVVKDIPNGVRTFGNPCKVIN